MSEFSILKPTYYGYIGDTRDAILVIQAVLNKKLEPVTRRLDPKERDQVIVLGNVFAFIEESSKIKRWTDGKRWSASRILGRFLMYRELDESNPHDIQIKGKKKKHNGARAFSNSLAYSASTGVIGSNESETEASAALARLEKNQEMSPNGKRPLQRILRQGTEMMDYRSGYIACPAKHDFHLMKKTISFMVEIKDGHKPSTWSNVHLISYFSPKDVISQALVRPTATLLAATPISEGLQEAVDKVLQNMKPVPGELEAYFIDSKYQLLKLLAPSKTLPVLNHDNSPNLFSKENKLHGPTIKPKSSYGENKLLLPDQRPLLGFMDSPSYTQQLGGYGSLASEGAYRSDNNVPHLRPSPLQLNSAVLMAKQMIMARTYSAGIGSNAGATVGGNVVGSAGPGGTVFNSVSRSAQSISSAAENGAVTQSTDSIPAQAPSISQTQVQGQGQSQNQNQGQSQPFITLSSGQPIYSTQPLQFSQSSTIRPMVLPISKAGSANGQLINQGLGSGLLYTRAEQSSPQPINSFLGSSLSNSNGYPVYIPLYSNTYGYRPELDALGNIHRRLYSEYHVSNMPPTSMGSYSLGYDQPYVGGSMFSSSLNSGYEQGEPNLERQDLMSMNRKLDSPVGFELSSSYFRAPIKQEDLEAGQHYDDNYQRI